MLGNIYIYIYYGINDTGYKLQKIYYGIYVTGPNILKSEMAAYYLTDLGWFGLAWLDSDLVDATSCGFGESKIYVL